MKYLLLFLLSIVSIAYSLDDITAASRPGDGDTIYVADVFDAIDTVGARTNQLNDSLDLKFVRFTDVKDSTFQRINADSVMGLSVMRGNPNLDSISGLNVMRGNPDIDSISGLNVMRGNPDIDSISGLNVMRGNPDIDSISGLNVMRGNPNIDSITGGVWWSGTGATFSDSVFIDTAKISVLHGTTVAGDIDFNGYYLIVDTDGDSRIYESADDVIVHSTGNAERLSITNSAVTISDSLFSDTLTSNVATIVNLSGTGATFSDSVYIDTANIGVITGDFKTVDWTDYSGTSSIGGWVSLANTEIWYKVIGAEVIVAFMLNGTSNSTDINFTVPYNPVTLGTNTSFFKQKVAQSIDNGSEVGSYASIVGGGSPYIAISTDAGAWTASGTKSVYGVFRYFKD